MWVVIDPYAYAHIRVSAFADAGLQSIRLLFGKPAT
jgi:hypothetical protein